MVAACASLLPDADDHPGDIYVTSDAGCTDRSFKCAVFDFTVHGATPDFAKSRPLLSSSCKICGAAAIDAEKAKVSDVLKREQKVVLTQKTDTGIIFLG